MFRHTPNESNFQCLDQRKKSIFFQLKKWFHLLKQEPKTFQFDPY